MTLNELIKIIQKDYRKFLIFFIGFNFFFFLAFKIIYHDNGELNFTLIKKRQYAFNDYSRDLSDIISNNKILDESIYYYQKTAKENFNCKTDQVLQTYHCNIKINKIQINQFIKNLEKILFEKESEYNLYISKYVEQNNFIKKNLMLQEFSPERRELIANIDTKNVILEQFLKSKKVYLDKELISFETSKFNYSLSIILSLMLSIFTIIIKKTK